jgi:hypothetical protein
VNVVALAEALATELLTPGQAAAADPFLTAQFSSGELAKARELARGLWQERPARVV